MTETVSVVIPCYNASPFLRETLESVLRQTHPPLEVIVVDDGSTDDSAAIAESFGSPVRVIRQKNQGESVARNRGIDEAHGEWVGLLDADDVWLPEKLERQLECAGPDATALHTAYFYFGAGDGIVNLEAEPAEARYSVQRICLVGNPCMPSSLLVRRECPVRFPTWTRYAEDAVYILQLTRHGRIELLPEALVGYRVHTKQQSYSSSVVAHWHRTVSRWLMTDNHGLNAETIAEIQRLSVERLIDVAETAYWKRQWADFRILRQSLSQYQKHEKAARLYRRWIYPDWVYAIKDRIDKLTARKCPKNCADAQLETRK
jgi:glycosyltransferase involved in cell wall biosynthesis